MEIAIIIAVVLIVILAFAINSSTSKTTKKSAEQQRLEQIQNQATDEAEEQRIFSKYQAQRNEEAEKKRLKEVTDQKKHEEEQTSQVEQQKVEAQRHTEEIQRSQAAEQQHQTNQQAERNLCEIGTNYCTSIHTAFNNDPPKFGFITIKSLSRNCGVWDELDNGVAQLESYDQLSQYIFSYGAMHQEKLRQAFQTIFADNHLTLNGRSFELIDYGSGQALGSICFIDMLKEQAETAWSLDGVYLIEPSILALKRGALHLKFALASAQSTGKIYTINKGLDSIAHQDLPWDEDTVKVHIFSNILDVEDFNINTLHQKIITTQRGLNLFVCVSPNFFADGNHSRNQRLDQFHQLFANQGNVTLISSRQSDINNPRPDGRPWKRYERIFKIHLGQQQQVAVVNTINLNTRVWGQHTDDLPF